MFTGIVQETGKISKILKKSQCWQLGVVCRQVYDKVGVSGSVAINGVCLTVVGKERRAVVVEVIPATLEKTNLKMLKIGDAVNLEASLALGERLEGHFVLGHVDTEGRVKKIVKGSRDLSLDIEVDGEFKKYLILRGSVAVDGISLTIAEVKRNTFSVNIIPYTWEHTTLKNRKHASFVNIEFDYLAKVTLNYLEKRNIR